MALTVIGVLLLLPSSDLYNLITTGSASGSISTRFAAVEGPSTASATEAVVGFGMIIVGVILEVFSIFTDLGARVAAATAQQTPAGPTMSLGQKPEETEK